MPSMRCTIGEHEECRFPGVCRCSCHMQVRGNVVTKHLRNQIQAAIGHALTEDGGPMSVANFATALVVEAIEAHGECHYCHRVDGEASI